MGSFSLWHWIIVLFILGVPFAIGVVVWVVTRGSRSRVAAASPGASVSAPTSPSALAESRLQELESLKFKGLISADEYQRQRAAILDSV